MTTKISSDVIQSDAITTAQIADGAISNDQLAGNISQDKLAGAIPISKLSTTGSPSSSNFLRGDGSWQDASERVLLYDQSNQNNVKPTLTLNNTYKSIVWEFDNPTGPLNFPFLVLNINNQWPGGTGNSYSVNSTTLYGDVSDIHNNAPGIFMSQYNYPQSTPSEGHFGYNKGILTFVGSTTGGANTNGFYMRAESLYYYRGYDTNNPRYTDTVWSIAYKNQTSDNVTVGLNTVEFLARTDVNNTNAGIYFKRARIWGLKY